MNKTYFFLEDLKDESLKRLVNEYYEDTVVSSKGIKSIEVDPDCYGYNPEYPEKSELLQLVTVTFNDGTTGTIEWNCIEKELG